MSVFSSLLRWLLRGELDRYNDRKEAELQAWVRGVKRIEARRHAV